MTWILAASLSTLRSQADRTAPNRSLTADGTIGDTAHQAQSWSDHNPDISGIVRALDLTHDPAHGLDAGALADTLAHSRDPRIKYLIWSRRVLRAYPKPGIPAWTWAPYTGDNPHTSHLHISVVADDRALNPAPWTIKEEDDMTPQEIREAVRAELSAWRIVTDDPAIPKAADGRRWISLGDYLGRRIARRADLGYARDQLLAAIKAGQANPTADPATILEDVTP